MQFRVDNNRLIPANRQAELWLAKQAGTVELKPVSQAAQRSLEANAKYWAWCGQIESEQGLSPGDAHRYNKWHIGLAILTRQHPEYRDRLLAMLRPLPYEQKLLAMDCIAVTSQFSRTEMTEFMDAVERHWAEHGICLM